MVYIHHRCYKKKKTTQKEGKKLNRDSMTLSGNGWIIYFYRKEIKIYIACPKSISLSLRRWVLLDGQAERKAGGCTCLERFGFDISQ